MGKKALIDERLKEAFNLYYEWWHPMDIACDSCMGAMSVNRFYETLLTHSDDWWDRWLPDSTETREKYYLKSHILERVLQHHAGYVDLNNK